VSSRPCVVLTREPEDNRRLAQALAERGVPVREIPCVQTRWLQPALPLGPFAAVAFASRRAVGGLLRAGMDPGWLQRRPRPLVAAVGEATRQALQDEGISVDLVAEPPTGRALAEALHARLPAGAVVLVPCGSTPGGGLEPGLRALGRPFESLPVYANDAPEGAPLEPFPVAAVFVAAPSAARRLLERAPWLRERPFLAIGPTTATALAELGVREVLGPAMDTEAQLAQLLAACASASSPLRR
jgi:uroporphyrinogen-III synthase